MVFDVSIYRVLQIAWRKNRKPCQNKKSCRVPIRRPIRA